MIYLTSVKRQSYYDDEYHFYMIGDAFYVFNNNERLSYFKCNSDDKFEYLHKRVPRCIGKPNCPNYRYINIDAFSYPAMFISIKNKFVLPYLIEEL